MARLWGSLALLPALLLLACLPAGTHTTKIDQARRSSTRTLLAKPHLAQPDFSLYHRKWVLRDGPADLAGARWRTRPTPAPPICGQGCATGRGAEAGPAEHAYHVGASMSCVAMRRAPCRIACQERFIYCPACQARWACPACWASSDMLGHAPCASRSWAPPDPPQSLPVRLTPEFKALTACFGRRWTW